MFAPWLVVDERYRPMAGLVGWAAGRGAPEAVVEGLRPFESHTHATWLYDITTEVLCEPVYGRVALPGGEVLDRSFAYAHLGIGPMEESLAGFAAAEQRGAYGPALDVAVSMHEPLENNYWHFHDDWLGKLLMLHDFGVDPAWPLLVSSHLFRSPLFEIVRRSERLRRLNWVEHSEVVRVGRLLVPVRGSLREGAFHRLGTFLPEPAHATSAHPRHLLLARKPERGRYLANVDAVAAALPWLEVVDADDLSIAEQADLFAEAKTVVGVHGAGLTNMVHRVGRGRSVTIVEIFPADFIHPHFAATSRCHDVSWSAAVGSPLHDGRFTVKAENVVAAVEHAYRAL